MLLRNQQTQNPLFLTLILEELVSFGVYERIEEEIGRLAASDSITDLLQKIFARLEVSFKVCAASHLLAAASSNLLPRL